MHKTRIQADQNINIKNRYIEPIEEKVWNSFEHIGTGDDFLNKKLESSASNKFNNKRGFMKLKRFCKSRALSIGQCDSIQNAKRFLPTSQQIDN